MKNIGVVSLISYLSFTIIFFIAKSRFGFKGTSWIWMFLIITGIIQCVNNLYITNRPEICGSYNMTSALIATIIPWIFIFGLSSLCLVVIPGWLRVFSNTFGAVIADLAGINKPITKIFVPTGGSDGANKIISETTNLLYTNRTKFINEVDLIDYDEATAKWDSLDYIIKYMGLPNPNSEDKKELYNKLVIKEDAGYFMWLLLIGSISILVSTNSLLITTCGTVDFTV